MLDIPKIMVRQGNKIWIYVREVRQGLTSYIFRRENIPPSITKSFLTCYFTRREINSYYVEVPTITEGEVVKTLPFLKHQILELKCDETVLVTNCYVGSEETDPLVIFFPRRAQYLEYPIKECLNQIYCPLVVTVILEFLDEYEFWQWKRELEMTK